MLIVRRKRNTSFCLRFKEAEIRKGYHKPGDNNMLEIKYTLLFKMDIHPQNFKVHSWF